ncbi:hypothetical protein FRB94_003684 [Tulasnella sp. JGI-2019a]|nr:hypothetical protein FRB93_012016 [Tulasnella sp. JGI-2019a]KAG9002710.1 hypothetical protein FRB94_003684 [Tulasnella sp. JGI-2019a]KAG9035374.1 hypothetical protein FRB95_011394 [Tulasnella sp. JGI-2019a]
MPAPPKPAVVDPVLSLQLRIRWLEALVLGSKQLKDVSNPNLKSPPASQSLDSTLWRRAEDIQSTLSVATESNEECQKFITDYNKYAHLLSPAAATSATGSTEAPTYDSLSSPELETLVLELEPDIRAADRDLKEIDELDARGVTAAGKLQDHEALKDRLRLLCEAQAEDLVLYDSLEARLSAILQNYVSHITRLSELFVTWNDIVTEAEERIDVLERQKREEAMVTF